MPSRMLVASLWLAATAIGSGALGTAHAAPAAVGFDRTGCSTAATVANARFAAGSRLNVRSGPGRQYGQTGRVAVGDTVRICTTTNEWTGIVFGKDGAGWIASSFLKANEAQVQASLPPSTTTRTAQEAGKPAIPHPEWTSAYERQSYKLGMTLSAFRGKPYPDAAKVDGVAPVCSNDAVIGLGNYSKAKLSSIAFVNAGVTKCAFFRKLEVSEGNSLALSVGLTLGDELAPTEFYFMAPKAGEEPVLFWIRTDVPANSADRIRADLRGQYGAPVSGGSEGEQQGATWKNAVSTIALKRSSPVPDDVELEYTLSPVMAELARRLGLRAENVVAPL